MLEELVPQFVERWLAGELDVDPFLTHTLTLDEVDRGFELMGPRRASGA